MLAHSLRILAAIAVISLAAPAHAQWTGKAELGFLQSGGNTESASANTKLDLKRDGQKWINTFYAAALYSENAEFSTAERYEGRYQADYKITDKLSWFGALRGLSDENIEVWLEQPLHGGAQPIRMKVSKSITLGNVGQLTLARHWTDVEQKAFDNWEKSPDPLPEKVAKVVKNRTLAVFVRGGCCGNRGEPGY